MTAALLWAGVTLHVLFWLSDTLRWLHRGFIRFSFWLVGNLLHLMVAARLPSSWRTAIALGGYRASRVVMVSIDAVAQWLQRRAVLSLQQKLSITETRKEGVVAHDR